MPEILPVAKEVNQSTWMIAERYAKVIPNWSIIQISILIDIFINLFQRGMVLLGLNLLIFTKNFKINNLEIY